ncbi:MAG: dihydrolipoamide acetyltransferase family protein [Deltaproteobacteria bacterium]|nr:dihydrolipoamide acetyltransferase family protein [Deltaproteobacteria bacterium]
MPVEIQMPNLGLSIAEGTIEKWLKKEGDLVEKGEVIVVLMTEKVTVEIPAEVSGKLLKILHPAGAVVKVGETIALIGEEGEQTSPCMTAAALSPTVAPSSRPEPRDSRDLKISPLALKIAQENGVDIREVSARFPGQKIGKKEIFDFIESKKKTTKPAEIHTAPDEEILPLTGPLRVMAEHMAASAQTAARVTTMAEVDMTDLVGLRAALKEKFKRDYHINLTFVPFVMKAMGEGIKEFPILNASLRKDEIVMHRAVHIGMAVDTGQNLLVPVVRDVNEKGVIDVSREVQQVTGKAKDGTLSVQDIQGGTITLTNAGVFGGLLATPIIHQPQSAILWMGKVMEMPVVREGQIVIRSMMYLCLSYDHRIIMGAQAVQFLQIVKRNLENPALLLLA